ncbi:hypothetical protein CCZ01_02260 [Helicobacter monodelphidis]|uniref:OmpA family protein n=1 Tax=Helicobacter sp. 15-1451 TaxID=2004995 RepID=UPI000DCB472E|nr:OmpA family protein [Helicobacter sp. 15-1451]RAX58630.1 hypothetical protein CCZ01_02260 [Helicobacter sp. 15-1451]
MAKCPSCDCPDVLPTWLGTFGDLMSLLLTFFILLLSMASFDGKKLSEAEGSIDGAMSILPGGVKTEPGKNRVQTQTEMIPSPEFSDEVRRVETLYIELQEMLQVSDGTSDIKGDGSEGFILRLPAGLLFDAGKVNIRNADGEQFVRRIAALAKRFPDNVYVEVRGHTDLNPLPTEAEYNDKLTLTAMRALSVSRIIKDQGFAADRIFTFGRGDKDPLTYARDAKSREGNERVDLHFYPKRLDEGQDVKNVIQENILQKTLQGFQR